MMINQVFDLITFSNTLGRYLNQDNAISINKLFKSERILLHTSRRLAVSVIDTSLPEK